MRKDVEKNKPRKGAEVQILQWIISSKSKICQEALPITSGPKKLDP
jgi:hypothetical protein